MKRRRRHDGPHEGREHASGLDRDRDPESLPPLRAQPQPQEEPFAVLGIAPTLDLMPVKRAYFAALARHPPHRDREGFQRLRAAYERLMAPEGLAAAYAASPPDLATELARYRARFDTALAQAARPREGEADAARAAQFIEQVSRMSWTQVLAALGSASRTSSNE
jgi:curved DNA-binding protein CbpA